MNSTVVPAIYGHAWVSKTGDATRNPETQPRILQEFRIREEHTFTDEMIGSSMSCTGWNVLMDHVRPDDIVVIARPDRFNRNFDADVMVQAELTKQNVGIVALR